MQVLQSYFLFLFKTFKVFLLFLVVLGGVTFYPSAFSSSVNSGGFVLGDESVSIDEASFISATEVESSVPVLEKHEIENITAVSTVSTASPGILSNRTSGSSRGSKSARVPVKKDTAPVTAPAFSFLLQNEMPDDLSPLWSKKIDSLTVNGPTTLADQDRYGVSITNLGDLDGDGVTDMAVGSHRSDVGGTDKGSLFIHFRNADGSIKSTYVINSQTPGAPALSVGDLFGTSVASIGDLNSDGTTDIAVGSYADDTGGENRGSVYIIFLNSNGSIKSFKKIDDNTVNGPVLANKDRYGASIANIGDRDGDNINDIAVGAQYSHVGDVDKGGAVFIHFMNADGSVKSTKVFNHSTPNITPSGLSINEADYYGLSISDLGDIDGDGVRDLGVGALGDSTMGTSAGAWYLHFMNADETIKSTVKIDGSTANGPSLNAFDYYGTIVNIGDLDDDGTNDVAVGAETFPNEEGDANRGMVYIHFLNTDGSIKSSLKINEETTGGPVLNDGDYYGTSIANMGDLNADGNTDIAVGSFWDDAGGVNRGAVYVHYLYSSAEAGDNKIVLPFNSTTCPSGWQPYSGAEGRMILGVGGSHTLGESGGSETHVQTISEMAPHSHGTSISAGQGSNSWGYNVNQAGYQYSPGSDAINFASMAQFSGMQVSVAGVGGGQAMNIMNPFIALIYCEKIDSGTSEIPSNAVMSFATSTCPSGWQPFEEAAGRRIIGTGQNGGSAYSFGETGGSKTVSQTIDQLPFHSHSVSVSNPNGSNSWIYNLNQVGYQYLPGGMSTTFVSVGQSASVSINVQNAGGGAPMDIMNPYIVLNYCEKVSDSGGQVMPSNAVASFESSTCPADWDPYTNANGRMVIGMGDGYTLGSVGGSETHTQTVNELAPHSHGTVSVGGGFGGGNSWMNNFNQHTYSNTPAMQGVNYIYSVQKATPNVSIVAAGEGQAMNIMNPYKALLYCGFDVGGSGTGGDSAGFTVSPLTITIDEDGGTGTFSVVLDVQPQENVVINVASLDTSKATVAPAILTFTHSNWNVPQIVTVTGIDDDVLGQDNVNIRFSINDTLSDDSFDALADKEALVILTDDDSTGGGGAGFTVFPTSITVEEDGGTGVFSVVLDVAPASNVVLSLTPQSSDQITLSSTSVVFTPQNWNTPQVITVTGVDDSVDQDESVNIIVSVVNNSSDDLFDSLSDKNVLVDLVDDETTVDGGGNGGGSNGGGGSSKRRSGQVLGEATLSCDAQIYLTKPVRLGYPNNPDDVMLLERFLNTYENANIVVDGFYSVDDYNRVVAWQEKYSDEILKPWGLTKGTGFVFITSLQKIKQTHKMACALSEMPTQILSCSRPVMYPNEKVVYGAVNSMSAVMMVEKYLNTYAGASVPVDGVFSPQDRDRVLQWQGPGGTGNVLEDSLAKMKEVHLDRCALFVINPEF